MLSIEQLRSVELSDLMSCWRACWVGWITLNLWPVAVFFGWRAYAIVPADLLSQSSVCIYASILTTAETILIAERAYIMWLAVECQ